jgi:hypothetical protein
MKRWTLLLLLPFLLYGEDLFLKSRLSSLDPLSVSEHLAFYELYSDTQEGKKALTHAWNLLSGEKDHARAPCYPALFLISKPSFLWSQGKITKNR